MKRILLSIFAGLMVLLNLVIANPAQAQPLIIALSSNSTVEQTKSQADPIEQLKAQVLPQLESILTPEQFGQLEAAVEGKKSLRKAFKEIALSPEQKTKLATVFKSLPKKDFFSSMTLEQKRQFFMKKKEMFKPTADEIAKYKAKEK